LQQILIRFPVRGVLITAFALVGDAMRAQGFALSTSSNGAAHVAATEVGSVLIDGVG
jgi:hypothetical protein